MTEEADGFRSSAFFIFSAPCGAKNGGFRRGKERMKSESKASEKAKRVKTAVWCTLGLAMLIYYFCEALFAGFRISLLWIWALGGGICLLFAALTRKFGRLPLPKWLFRTGLALFCVVFALFLVAEGFVIAHMNDKGEQSLDYIVVLGAHLRGSTPSNALLWRIDAAEEYLAENPDTRAVLSGGQGHGEDISEAQCMYNVLTARGVAPERLILEAESTDTYENIRNSLKLMEADASFGIVTNNFHVFRATKLAEKMTGKPISGIASPYKNALVFHYMVREFVSITVELLEGNI